MTNQIVPTTCDEMSNLKLTKIVDDDEASTAIGSKNVAQWNDDDNRAIKQQQQEEQ